MKKIITINNRLNNINCKSIELPGDKSISIRFLILSSMASGTSEARNLLKSEDTQSTINSLRKLGIKIILKKNKCKVYGKGLNGYKYKKNLILNAGNSGTCARLILPTLIDTDYKIKITGDESLCKRDMTRIIVPLKKFGANIKDNKGLLPIVIDKPTKRKPINYFEKLGSAQCKSAVMIAALKTKGTTTLKCKKSRNHSELMFKNVLNVPMSLKETKKFDFIKIKGQKNLKSFKYNVPSDISSASFFIALTLLVKNSKLILKNINTNNSRIGFIRILNMMGANIELRNKRIIKGEQVSDIYVKYVNKLKSINLNPILNSSAIDEFLLVFIIAAVSKGISKFNNLSELNKKESKRLDWGIKILKLMGIKVIKLKNDGIKIWGNPNLKIKKEIIIKNFLKDHRIFMVCVVAGLALGGKWKIHNPESVKTSFPQFFKIIKRVGGKLN